MKSRAILPQARLSALASLLATSALLAACGGGSGGSEAPKPLAANAPSGQAASAAAADSASAPASGAAAEVAAAASAAASAASTTAGAANQGSPTTGSTTAAGTSSGSATGSTTASTGSTGTVPAGVTIIGTANVPGAGGTAAGSTSAPAEASAKIAAGTETAAAPGDVFVYVETTGNDTNTGAVQSSGGSDGPVKTLARAQQLARAKIAAMVAGSATRAPVRVAIGPGEYALTSALTFNTADSGTAAAPVSYEARQAGTVLISGGLNLGSQVAPTAATAITYTAPVDAAAVAGGSQLFVNGRRAILARQPNEGAAWFVQRATPLATEPAGSQGYEAFAPAPADLAWINGLSAADKKRAIVDVFQSWTNGRHRISEEAVPAGSLRITPKAKWAFLSLGGVSQRYFVENVAAALDSAGEWIYDNGAVRYIRRADEVGAQVKATLPTLERLILIQGDAATPVQSLQFSGLTFGYTKYVTPASGFSDVQAGYNYGAAIEVNKARGVLFDRCSVYRTATWGIWFKDGVRDSQISNSSFADMGAGGIKIGLNSQAASDVTATGANRVINNTVSETGKVFPGAVAVWLGQTWDNQVRMNSIYNTTNTAISVGWSWGYAAATSGRNLINGNLIYNIGQRQVGDIAGIYTLGQSPGTVISNNIIRSVRGYTGYGAGAWGIYNDEGTSDLVMENNVVLGTDNGGYHINYGKNNTVRNNILAGGDIAELRVTKLDTSVNAKVQGNLIAPKVLQPFDQYAETPGMSFTGNEVTPTLSGAGLVLTKCGSGCSIGSSPIQSTTSPIDITTTNPAWAAVIANAVNAWSGVPVGPQLTARVAARNLPPVADAPTALVAPAIDFNADIAGSAINARPINLKYLPKDNTTAIRVETQADAPNGKCLAFNDGATFANRWEPYTYAQLNYTSGTTTVEFDLKIDSTTVMLSEWRDTATIYSTGPAMRITSAGVMVNGNIVAPVTVGAWTKFRVVSMTGVPGSKWSLEVIRSSDGQKTSVSDLAPKDAGWKNMSWLGFVSDTASTSRPCLATIKASNVSQ